VLPHACGDGHHVLTLCLCKPDNFVDLRLKAVGSVQIGDGGQLHVTKHYEVRRHFLLNIDLVLSFEKNL
jgi:hypothetical protein